MSRRRPRAGSSSRPRHAFSLLEVLLALAILLIALTGIGQLISVGTRAAIDARLESEATLRAECALQELLGGVQPMQSTSATPFEGDPDWHWMASVVEGPHVDLLQVTVTAYRQGPGEDPRGHVSLPTLVRGPQIFLDAAMEAQ